MHWDTWALLAITALCGSVILWSWWGFHNQTPTPGPNYLRLSIIGGGHLDVPRQADGSHGRHRRTSRQTRQQPRRLHQLPRQSRA